MKNKKLFTSQNDDEKIIKTMHRHQFTFVRDGFGSIFLFFASLAVMIIFFYSHMIFLAAFLVFVFSIIGGFYSYFTWDRDKFIITSQRIIDIEQKTLFTKSQKEAYLDKIQDISFEINGFWGSVFHYGTVNIQTASDSVLSLDDVGDPESIQKIIFSLVKDRNTEDPDEGNGLMEKMTEMIRKAINDKSDQ